MYFIQFREYYSKNSIGYVAQSPDKVKQILINLFTSLSNRDENGELTGWGSLNDEVEDCISFKDIASLCYEFADGCGAYFRFTEFKEGEEIKIME